MACLLTAWWCWLYSTYLSNHLHLMFKKWFCKKFLFCLVHYRPKIYYQVAQCEGISIVLCTLWMKQGELCTNKPRKKIYCCKYYFFSLEWGRTTVNVKNSLYLYQTLSATVVSHYSFVSQNVPLFIISKFVNTYLNHDVFVWCKWVSKVCDFLYITISIYGKHLFEIKFQI